MSVMQGRRWWEGRLAHEYGGRIKPALLDATAKLVLEDWARGGRDKGMEYTSAPRTRRTWQEAKDDQAGTAAGLRSPKETEPARFRKDAGEVLGK